MNELVIEKEPVSVDVHVGQDKLLRGDLFLGRSPLAQRRERLGEPLCNRRFVPFRMSDRVRLMAVREMLWVRTDVFSAIDELDPVAEDDILSRIVSVVVDFDDTTRLQGEIHYSLPGLSQRLTDYIEAAPRFVPLRTEDWVYFVNLERVVSLTPVEEDV